MDVKSRSTKQTGVDGDVAAPSEKDGGVLYAEFFLPEVVGTTEHQNVLAVARSLRGHLNRSDAQRQIAAANVPSASSSNVQMAFQDFARELGFESEKNGLFSDLALALRPDYFKPLENSGIILEVERGKTTINNMDLMDFWKCHLCGRAHFLFLLVPRALRQNATMRPRNEFATVTRRLALFFQPGNGTNVHGLVVYGY